MAARFRRLKIGVALFVAVSLVIVLLAPSPVVPATASEVGSGDIPLSIQNFSLVSQDLINEADELAIELFGSNQQKCQEFTSQLLTSRNARSSPASCWVCIWRPKTKMWL